MAGILREAPAGEPLHVMPRRASLALAELEAHQEGAERFEQIEREPTLTASAARQAGTSRNSLNCSPRAWTWTRTSTSRPAASAAFGALNAAWSAWGRRLLTRPPRKLVDEGTMLDTGFEESLTNTSGATPASSSGRTTTP